MRTDRKIVARRLAPVLIAMVLAAGVVLPQQAGLAADPEPWTNPDQEYHFDPGPGWPAGWTPPPEPVEVSASAREGYEDMRRILTGTKRPEQLELRVWKPLPEWTQEYPWYWMERTLLCGQTYYVYYYPFPDTELTEVTWNKNYSVSGGSVSGTQCLFTPVVAIQLNPEVTEEHKRQLELDGRRNESIDFAMNGLSRCNSSELNGTLEAIVVCFNNGYANDRFDVAAYLDTTVSRVRVPLRFVSELMGADVNWNGETQTVTLQFPALTREVIGPEPLPGFQPSDWWNPDAYTLNSETFRWAVKTVSQPARTIVLTIGEPAATVDGRAVVLDAPPVIRDGRTMVPVRFVAEAMGAKVYWVGSEPIFNQGNGRLGGTYQVYIYTLFWPYFDYPSWFLETRARSFQSGLGGS